VAFKLYGGTAVSCADEKSKDGSPSARTLLKESINELLYGSARPRVALDKAGLLVKSTSRSTKTSSFMPLVRWPFRASPKTNGARSCSPTSSMSRDASTASSGCRNFCGVAENLRLLIDATRKWDYPPCRPKREYMQRAKQLCERLEYQNSSFRTHGSVIISVYGPMRIKRNRRARC